MKAYEKKVVFETNLINKAVSVALHNAYRKKGKQALPMWRKRPKRGETDELKETIARISAEKDKSWVAKIHRASGKIRR